MKFSGVPALLGLFFAVPLSAQVEIPSNPMVTPKAPPRSVGGGVNPGASVGSGKTASIVRYVTHITLHESRLWTSNEGKPLEAKLIAFEDLVAEAPPGATEPAMPPPPANPTVTRYGKIRLLINRKPTEVPLDRLSEADRELVKGIQAALAKKAATGK